MLRAVVTGVSGRMGQTLVRAVLQDRGMALVGGTQRPGGGSVGQDLGALVGAAPLGIKVADNLASALESSGAQAVIDFTSPAASVEHARACADRGVPLVIGSTGFSASQRADIERAASRIPIVLSPNMSVGVNVVWRAAADLARALGPGFDVEIVEAHHRMKKDAPSGTALRLAEEVAGALGRGSESFRFSREGQIGERPPTQIGIQSVRGGDVVGDHTVFFLGDGERVELSHRATSRDQFAKGALRAARWLLARAPGLYDMQDVLGL